jgi:hypothetical protein
MLEKSIKQIQECERRIADLSSRMSRETGKIQGLIPFEGFDELGLEPEVHICSGDEIIVYCKGYELVLSAVIEKMRKRGYISPCDFPSNLTDIY